MALLASKILARLPVVLVWIVVLLSVADVADASLGPVELGLGKEAGGDDGPKIDLPHRRDLATTFTIINQTDIDTDAVSDQDSVTGEGTNTGTATAPAEEPSLGTNFRLGVPFNFSHIFFLGGNCGHEDPWYTDFVMAGLETLEVVEFACPEVEDGIRWWMREYSLEALKVVEELAGDKLNETLVITVGVGLETDWTPVADLLRKGMAFFHAKEDPIESLNFNLTEHGLVPEEILYLYFQWDEISAAERNGIELCRLKGGHKQLKVAKLPQGNRDSAPLNYRIDIALESFKEACPDVEVIEVWEMYGNVTEDTMKATLLFNPLPDVVLTCRDMDAEFLLQVAYEVLTPEEYGQISTTGWDNVEAYAYLLDDHRMLMTVNQMVHYPNEGIWRAIDTVVTTVQETGLNSTTAIQSNMDRGDSVTISADTLTVSGDRTGYLLGTLLSVYDVSTAPFEEVKVTTGMVDVSITKMDPFEGKFEAVTWLRTSWHDPRLRWNPILYSGVLPIDLAAIWIPQLYFQNEFMHEDLYSAPAIVTFDGRVIMETNVLSQFLCKTTEELRSFPFDSYNCSMDLGAPMGVTMNQNFGFEVVDSDSHYITTTATSLGREGHDPDGEPDHSQVVYFQLFFERRPFTTYMRLIIPAVLINLIGFMSFWIPELPESVALGITSLLCSLAFRETVEMPNTADITWTEIFMMVNIGYLASVLFITWCSYSSSTRLGAFLNSCCDPFRPENVAEKGMRLAATMMTSVPDRDFLGRAQLEMEEKEKLRLKVMKGELYREETKKNDLGFSCSSHYPELKHKNITGDGTFWDTYKSISEQSQQHKAQLSEQAPRRTSQHWTSSQHPKSSRHVPMTNTYFDEDDDDSDDDEISFALDESKKSLRDEPKKSALKQETFHSSFHKQETFRDEEGQNPAAEEVDMEDDAADDGITVVRERINVDWIGRWFIVPSYFVVLLTLLFGGWGYK